GGSPGTGGGGAAGGAGSGGAPAGPGVTGELEGEDGQPVGSAPVQLCNTSVCYSDASRADGGFTFLIEANLPVDFLVKSLADLSATPRRGVSMVPLRLTEPALRDVGSLFVPSLPAGATLGPASSDPQTLDVGDGLRLVVRRADLDAPIGTILDDIAARKIPPERVPALPDLGAEQVIAVYALHPFATRSDSPIAVQAPSDLAPGTPVTFRTMSEYDGKLSAPVEGQADGTVVETAPLTGIDELTWLVITR
ncbi:MAG TPA: hypothetical protein VLS89_11620, partial [Candidatus Nanopelagicales bacterium]|nr:hypothetical protein [Candidatus Nanopelagicales bacterium]